MKIGIDIDNTIVKTFFKTSLICEKLYNKSMDDLDKISQYEFSALHEKEIFDNLPLEDDAKDIINKLYNEKNEIYFITSRCDRRVNNIEKRTISYLKKEGILYTDIFFGSDFKYDIYKKLSLDVMIDDDYDVYEKIANNNGNCILYEGVLNKNKEGYKADNWKEIYNIIKERKYLWTQD